jgi:hypothetical protein
LWNHITLTRSLSNAIKIEITNIIYVPKGELRELVTGHKHYILQNVAATLITYLVELLKLRHCPLIPGFVTDEPPLLTKPIPCDLSQPCNCITN